MFDNLTDKLESAFQSIKGQGRITEINVAQALKEVRRALVEADVSYKIAKEFVDSVKTQAIGENVIKSVHPRDMLIKIANDKLVELMGSETAKINISKNPSIILLAGLQGSGKTTFAAKLAKHLKSKGKNPLLVAGDVYRPAAILQLETLAKQIGVDVFSEQDNKNPVDISQKAISHAKSLNKNIIIVDTAGRLAIDETMMTEISSLKENLNPQETLFVVDSMTGQDAVNTAKAFNDKLDFDGVILTKLDGDTRGGAALTIRKVVDKPIKFVSTGEKLADIDLFHPERMASRILGKGDIVSLVEKAQQAIDDKEAQRLEKRFKKNQFDFNDFLSQIKQVKKMGNVKDLVKLIPGMGKMAKGLDNVDNNVFKQTEAMILSMKPSERKDPKLINAKVKKRIAKGSGTSLQQVNQLLKQVKEMKKMMKMMNKGMKKGKMPKMPF